MVAPCIKVVIDGPGESYADTHSQVLVEDDHGLPGKYGKYDQYDKYGKYCRERPVCAAQHVVSRGGGAQELDLTCL